MAEALWHLGVASEYADARGVLAIVGPGLGPEDVACLAKALERVPRGLLRLPAPGEGTAAHACAPDPDPVSAGMPPDRARRFDRSMLSALRSPAQWVPLSEAAGFRSADFVAPYPPGIPWILPGERVGTEVLLALVERWRAGAEVHGITKEGTMKVIHEGSQDIEATAGVHA